MPPHKIHAPMASTVVEVLVAIGQPVRAGQALLVIEAMKMEHEIRAEADGRVLQVGARAGELVAEGDLLLLLGALDAQATATATSASAVASPSKVETEMQPKGAPALQIGRAHV